MSSKGCPLPLPSVDLQAPEFLQEGHSAGPKSLSMLQVVRKFNCSTFLLPLFSTSAIKRLKPKLNRTLLIPVHAIMCN